MKLIKTNNEFAFPHKIFCEQCNLAAEYVDSRPNGDTFVAPDFPIEGDEEVWFNLYRCPYCGHITPDAERPQWSNPDDEALYEYVVQRDNDAAQPPSAADSADSAATFDALCDALLRCSDDMDYYNIVCRIGDFVLDNRATIRAALRPLSDGDSGKTGGGV